MIHAGAPRKDDARLAQAYAALQQAVEFVGRLDILPFDTAAIQIFRLLRTQHRRLSTNDLRIGAIALRFGAVLVTRNQNDFAGLAGLSLEDWS